MSSRKRPLPPLSPSQTSVPLVRQQQIQQVTQTVSYSGPLPNAAEMEKYRQISPDWPERIIAMAEKEQAARLAETQKRSEREDATVHLAQMESERANELLKVNSRNTLLGQIFGFLSLLVVMAATVFCAIANHPITAGFIGSGGIAMVIAAFVVGSKIRSDSSLKK